MLPPLDRPMTEEERRGFVMACRALQHWGAQIVHNGIRLGGPEEPMVPRHKLMEHGGRMVAACAEALERTLAR